MQPRPAETHVSVGAAQLYVRDIGSGLPIIVPHGGPDFDHEYLLPELDRLADLARLVYYDQRGRGRSYMGERPNDVSIDSETADLDRLREWIGSDAVALLGHSWGTLLALEYAIRHAERVSHLILMNPAPASHAQMLLLRRRLARRRSPEETERMKALASDPAYLAGEVGADAEYYRIHFGTTLHRTEHLDQVIRRLRRGFTPEGIVAARAIEGRLYEQTWRIESYDLLPRLRQLHTPALVIRGDDDFIPEEVARGIVDAIPGSRLLALPECGHFAYLEQPEPVQTAIAELLAVKVD